MSVKHYARTKEKKISAFNKNRPLAEYLIPLIGDKKEVSILDAGSGPILTTGNQLEGVDVHITACDKLANEYKKIYGDLLFDVEYQDMEALTYEDNSFDIVHCVNALEHTKWPKKALRELMRVAKHFVYLRHHVNEGENQNYSGLHRWNIELVSDDCRVWRPRREFFLSEFGKWTHKHEEEVYTTDYPQGKQIISIHALHKV